MPGSWFTARRQDRMWLREQRPKAGAAFSTTVTPLVDHLHDTRLGDDRAGANELRCERTDGPDQEARPALHLLCADDIVDVADALARRVRVSRPGEGGTGPRGSGRRDTAAP